MKKIIISIVVIIFLVYAIFKYANFYAIAKNMNNIDYNEMLDYAEIYFYTYNKYPEDITSFNKFLEKYNPRLYSSLKQLDYHPIFTNKSNQSFDGFYANGFDNDNDSLKKQNYAINEIDFEKYFNFNGDLYFNIKKAKKTYKTNTVYRLEGDSLVELKVFPLELMYKKALNCENIKLKNIDESSETKFVLLRLSNGKIDNYNHSFVDSSFGAGYGSFTKSSLEVFKIN